MFRDTARSTRLTVNTLHGFVDEDRKPGKPGKTMQNVTHGNLPDEVRSIGENEPSQDSPKQNQTIRSSISDLWTDFRDNTSMHGLKKTERARKYKLRGIIWVLAVVGMGIFLIAMVCELYRSYISYPTLTNIHVEEAECLAFPAVTVCNLSPLNRSKINMTPQRLNLMVKTGLIRIFAFPINWNTPEYYNFTLPRETELNISAYDPIQSFGFCFFEQRSESCSQIFKQRITSLGMCSTFNFEGTIKSSLTGSQNGLSVVLFIHQDHYDFSKSLAAGVKVTLHHPSEEPNVEHDGFLASPGFSTYAAVKPTKYKYLARPYKAFKNNYCLETDANDFENKLKYYSRYSYYACLNECRLRFMERVCHCRLESDPGNGTICSFRQELECYQTAQIIGCVEYPHQGDLAVIHSPVLFDTNKTLHAECECEYPCRSEKYEQQISTAYFPSEQVSEFVSSFNYVNLRKNVLELRVFFDSMRYTEVEQVPEYTLNSLAGSLGGLMGIFLGASILTLSELVEFLLLSAWIILKHLLQGRQNVQPR